MCIRDRQSQLPQNITSQSGIVGSPTTPLPVQSQSSTVPQPSGANDEKTGTYVHTGGQAYGSQTANYTQQPTATYTQQPTATYTHQPTQTYMAPIQSPQSMSPQSPGPPQYMNQMSP